MALVSLVTPSALAPYRAGSQIRAAACAELEKITAASRPRQQKLRAFIAIVSLSRTDHAPDAGAFIVHQEKGAVAGDGKLRRRAPYGQMAFDGAGQSGDEVIIPADRCTVLETHPNHLVAVELVIGARYVQGDKGVASIFRRKLRAGIKH